MMEIAVVLMQIASAGVLVAGGVLSLDYVLAEERVAAPGYGRAGDFEVDYRRVLAFARLPVHR